MMMASQKVHLLRDKLALVRTLTRPHQYLLRNYTSLRRTSMYDSSLSFRKPYSWNSLLCHRVIENLRVHQ